MWVYLLDPSDLTKLVVPVQQWKHLLWQFFLYLGDNEDDNALVRGISGDEGSLGYFGYAYYAANKDKLRVVAIDGGKGPVAPTEMTINNGTYAPLSRPVFIYVRPDALDRKEVRAFVDFYIESAPMLATEVGYIPLPDSVYAGAKRRVELREIGTAYHSEALPQSANLLTDN